MNTRYGLRSAVSTFTLALLAAAQSPPRERPLDRINRLSDTEQVALAKLLLNRGLPPRPDGDPGGGLDTLAVHRSALVLPLIEAKIEEVLRAPDPAACFTDKSVKPDAVILYLQATIWQTGNLQALREASKLLKIDEKRFDKMVANTMYAAYSRNPFKLAYQAFEIGDPAIDKRLVDWAEEFLSTDLPKLGNPIFDNVSNSPRRFWAEALVDRYDGVPSPTQWMSDPIASRLRPGLAALDYDVRRFATEAAEKRARKR